MARFAPAMQNAPALGQPAGNNSGFGRFGFGYGNAAGSPVARAPMVYAVPTPAGNGFQMQRPGAAVQMQQPGTTCAGGPAFLSPNAMAKLKEFTVDHHWRQRSKQLVPLFSEAGNGAKGLNYPQLQKFYDLAGIEFFGEPLSHMLTPDIFERFDFNGDGMLEFVQAFKSLKCILYEAFHNFGGETIKPIEWKSPEQKGYTIIKELARGGQGAAILASSVERGQVVLKTYEKSNPNAGTIEEHIAEMQVLKELQNEDYVMHAWDIFQDAKCVYCVNELMAGGDLEALREKAGKAGMPLTQSYFQNVFKQTLLGLDHIHEHGLMHCDLKEPNIMMKNTDLRNPQIAIIDFGLAHVCAGPGEAGGTPGYVPPETNTSHIWYPKGDIFSLGVAFFQLLADKTPQEKLGKLGVFQEGFRTLDDVVMFTATRQLPWHLIQQAYPGVMSWLPGMCSKEKKPRPRALQLLRLPFFSDAAPENGSCNESSTTLAPNGNQAASDKHVQFRSQLVSHSQFAGPASLATPASVYNSHNAIWTMNPGLQSSGTPGGYSSYQPPMQLCSSIQGLGSPGGSPNRPSVAAPQGFCFPGAGAPPPCQQPQQMQVQYLPAGGAPPPRQQPPQMQVQYLSAGGPLSPRQQPQQMQVQGVAGGTWTPRPQPQQMQIQGFAAGGALSPRQQPQQVQIPAWCR